jgi:ribosomal-protein-alanine N-acetyltransferase
MEELLETRRIKLLPLEEKHLPTLHTWRNDPVFLENCTNRRDNIAYDEFVLELKNDFDRDLHEQFLIQLKSNGELIGTVYSYGLKKADAYAFVTIFLAEQFRTLGYSIDAMALCLNHLFTEHQLYKIYMEVYEYNRQSLSVIRNAGFMEEGRFTEQRLHNGKRFDVLRYAVFRDQLTRITDFLHRLNL